MLQNGQLGGTKRTLGAGFGHFRGTRRTFTKKTSLPVSRRQYTETLLKKAGKILRTRKADGKTHFFDRGEFAFAEVAKGRLQSYFTEIAVGCQPRKLFQAAA